MTISSHDIRTIINRYEAHLDHIEAAKHDGFSLRPGQMALARDIVDYYREKKSDGTIKDSGYFVRPTGTGKTVSFIDFIIGANTLPSGASVMGDQKRGKRTLVMVPTNVLLDQWENELLGPAQENGSHGSSKWGDSIKPEDVGVYRADDSNEQRKLEALSKPIVVVTYDSAMSLCVDKRKSLHIDPADFAITLLDEVHANPRGDATGDFIKKEFMGNTLVLGGTATHLYKSNKTIGDYLFGGEIPIHETTFREAVNRGEIAPMRNVIADVELDAVQKKEVGKIVEQALARSLNKGASLDQIDFSEAELEQIVEIAQRDEAAIRLLKRGFDPDTGKAYKEMKQVWYCASVKHAEHLAAKLNEAMGKDYAVAVHGDMSRGEQNKIILNYRNFKHHALANCQLLTMGFDDKEAELCMQLAPTCSPTRSLQQGGRVMRVDPNNPDKIANIVTFRYPDIPGQVLFGELAGGFSIIPEGFEFPPTQHSQASGGESRVWPDIDGLKVHYTTEQLALFKEQRDQQRYVNGLPSKTENMLTPAEMAKIIFPKASQAQLEKEAARLERRVYEPLEDAYNIRQAREKAIEFKNISSVGQRFPVSQLGHFRHDGQEVFCIGKHAAVACKFGIYGRLQKATPNLISETQARQILGVNDQEKWQELIDPLKDAYLDRNYATSISLGPVKIPAEHLRFCANQHGSVGLYMQPDVLQPLFQLLHNESAQEAQNWVDGDSSLKRLKTSDYVTKDECTQLLGLSTSLELQKFDAIWRKIEQAARVGIAATPGEDKTITITVEGRKKDQITVAQKTMLNDNGKKNEYLCIKKEGLDMLRYMLDMESAYSPPIRSKNFRSY